MIVAALDNPSSPKAIEVYIFPADEVRKRFNSNYAARIKNGHKVKDNFGMWVSLDRDDRNIPASQGSGIIEIYRAVEIYAIEDIPDELTSNDNELLTIEDASPQTIGEALSKAREQIAILAGVSVDAVKLDLKIEY